jgi:hypothetical protein
VATVGCSSKGSKITVDAGFDDPESSDSGAKPLSTEDDNSEADDAGIKSPADAGKGCIASPSDDPDDNFTDTNCDGIDGDKNKAIFVAPTGSDSADGSMEKPVATLGHGIELANAKSKDVYLCKGDYSEATVQLSAKGVRVYGGYDCTAHWVRNSLSQARLVSTSSMAVAIQNVNDSVVFDRVDIQAASATTPSGSSIAVFVSNSKNVALRRGMIQAGDGANGVQPTAKAAAVNSLPNCYAYVYSTGKCYGEPGSDAYQYKNCFYNGQATGGTILGAAFTDPTYFRLAEQSTPTQINECHDGTSSNGGKGGGTSFKSPMLGTDGTPGLPPSTTGNLDGGDGAAGVAGAAATQGFGMLNDGGYVASNNGLSGTGGVQGQAGTGGNGGGFTTVFSAGAAEFMYYLYAPRAGGGNGGWGGCAGDGGDSGNAGGASIAVASYRSTISLEHTTLVASNGGKGSAGGLGADGATGQPGGSSGVAYYSCAKCVTGEENYCAGVPMTNTTSAQAGGNGGKGGAGAQGGPGGGGPSVSLLTVGNAPTLSAVTYLPGSGGQGGSNGGARAADGESTDQKVMP